MLTINKEGLPSDEGRSRPGQENRHFGDILWYSRSTPWVYLIKHTMEALSHRFSHGLE